MLGVINLIIGIALAAGKVLFNPSEVAVNSAKQFFKKLGIGLTDADSELIGDASQGLISKVADAINKHRERSKLKVFFENNLKDLLLENGEGGINPENKIGKIFNEIKEEQKAEKNNRNNKPIKPQKENKNEKQQKFDRKVLMEISDDLVFFHADAIAYLKEYSTNFKSLYEHEDTRDWAESFAQLIDITVDVHIKRIFYKSSDDFKVLAYIIVHEFKDHEATREITLNEEQVKELSNELIQKILPYLANQSGGVINFQAVANAKYAPKYIKNACPGCGYDGDRLLVDEKTGTVKCAACGKSYNLVQYAEPELYEKMEAKLQELNQKWIKEYNQLNDKLDAKLNNLERQNQLNSKNLMCAIGELKTEKGELLGDNFKKVFAGLKDDNEQWKDGVKTIMERLNNLGESLKSNNEIQKQFAEQCKLGVTKEYLDACLKGQTEQFSEKIESLIDDKFNAVTDSVFSNLQHGQQEILDFLKKKTEEDRQVVGHFSQKLDSLDKQVNSLYEYAKEMFPELSGKSDLILEYVQKLCSKEYYEEMSNALGTDINKAISMEMKHGYEHIQALNSTSVSQIISAIEDLKKDCTKEGGVDQKKIEDSIRNANVQLSGQITGLQSLVEKNHKESRAAFKEIIRSQDEIKAILLARIGLKVESHDFEKMYKGEIPSEYLLDEGIGEPFPCPYCGVKEERRISADGYCKCKICGQKFLAVSPFFPADKFAREHDDFRATEEKIKDWRKNHEAKLENKRNGSYKVTIRESTHRDGILIIPNTDCNGNNIEDINNTNFWQENTLESSVGVWDVKYLLFGESINTLGHNGGKAFNQLTELKAVIFYQEDNLTRIGENVLREFRKCLGSSTTIYGQRAQPVNWNLAKED